MLCSFYAFLAFAQVAGIDPPPATYSDSVIEPYYVPTPIRYRPQGNGQCVNFVQAYGFSKYSGNALTWSRYINTTIPEVGDVVILAESPFGHLAIITAITDTSFEIVEQNYSGPYIVSRRTISSRYSKIIGFIK